MINNKLVFESKINGMHFSFDLVDSRLGSKVSILTLCMNTSVILNIMLLKLIFILFLVGFSESFNRKQYAMKSSLKGRTLLQRPRSRHENGLPFSCVPNCKIGVPFTFMIPFGTECPENMEDIEQVKVSTKDYCLAIPQNRKVCIIFDTLRIK